VRQRKVIICKGESGVRGVGGVSGVGPQASRRVAAHGMECAVCWEQDYCAGALVDPRT